MSSHASRFSLAAVLILAGSGCSFGSRPLLVAPPPPGQELAPVAPGPATPSTPASPAPSKPVDLYLAVGYDVGFTTLVDVTYSDGSTGSLKANGGLVLSAGATFLKLLDGKVSTRASVGLKYDTLKASNGSVSYRAFPLEVVEQFNAGPVRLGAGLSLSLAPRLSGSGAAASLDARLDPSVGLLLEGRYVFGGGGGSGRGMGLGPRLLWQRLRSTDTGATVDANALGLVLDFTL